MIESKFKKDTIVIVWVALSFTILYLGALTYYVIFYVANPADGGNHIKEIIIALLACSSLLFFFAWLKNAATIITIGTVQKTISFRNFFY